MAASRTYDEEGVVIHSENMELSVMNPIGTRIWELVDGERPVRGIVEAIYDEFDVDRETAEADVFEFLEELHSRDLIQLEEDLTN